MLATRTSPEGKERGRLARDEMMEIDIE